MGLIWVGEGQSMEEGGEEKVALVAWMCVVGAAVGKGEVREWFVGKLGRMGVRCAGDEETGMEKLFSLTSVFDKGCLEKIWEEARMSSGVVIVEEISSKKSLM